MPSLHLARLFRRSNPTRPLAPRDVIESLERRVLFSTILWSNRGSDSFSTYYGASASAARAVVDRALADWGRVIANFNYGSGNGNTFTVTINAGPLDTGGRGLTSGNIGLTNSKPSSATITLDDNGGGAGWYFDPTPGSSTTPDDGEFTSLITKFTANAPASVSGNDFYRTITHELGHAMGISIGNGDASIPATNTNITDPNDPDAKIWKYVAPSGTYTYTDNGGGHVYEGPAVGGLPIYPNDLLNSGRTIGAPPSTRELITDDDALMLRDAHGYTINLPSTLNTFLANFNSSTGVVTVNEDPDTIQDSVTLSVSGANELFAIDGTTELIANSGILNINVATKSGLDTINVKSIDAGSPVSIANTGVTTVNLGDSAQGVLGLKSPISITNTSITSVNISDAGDSTARTINLDNDGTTATLAFLGLQNIYWTQANVINVTLVGSSAADTVNIRRSSENLDYDGNSGADTINVGNTTNGLGSITSTLTLHNAVGFNTILLDDSPDAVARTITHDTVTHSSSNYGRITGFSSGAIEYKYVDTNAASVTTGAAADTVNVLRTGKPFSLNSANGNDVVNVGSVTAGGVQNILGQVTIDNNPAFSVVTIDDAGDSTARTITLDEISNYNTITGMAPALIRFDSNDTSGTTIRTGSAADTVNVIRNDEVKLTVTTAGGADTVNLGDPAALGVQGITASLTISNPSAYTTLTINDTGDTAARTISIDTVGTLTTITGFAPGTINFVTSDISVAAANPTILTTGSAADAVTLLRSSNPLKFASAGGTDAIIIGNATNGVQSISAVNVTNSPSFTTIVIDDAANTFARTVTIAAGSVTGIAPGSPITWATTDVTAVTINGGSGGNTFNASAFSNATTINAGSANDAVLLTPSATGSLTLNGQAGAADSLTLTDTAAASQTYALTATTLTRGSLSVTFATIESITINAGSLPDTFNINGTAAATPVTVNAAGGTDTINVIETAPTAPVTILPSAGNDTVNVNTDATGSAFALFNSTQTLGTLTIGTGGTATLAAGGSIILFANTLTMTGGRLDLKDDSLLLDPGTAATIRNLLQTGYNAGAWNGTGILSSTAAADAQHLHSLGYASTADLGLSSYGGQSVSPSALLVKYALAGDANLNGKVDHDDYALADRGKAKGFSVWDAGDFDYNASVGASDYLILDHAAGIVGIQAPATPPPAIVETPIITPTIIPLATTETTPPTPTPAVTPTKPTPTKPKVVAVKKPTPAKTATKTTTPKKTITPKVVTKATKPLVNKRPLQLFSSFLIKA